MKLQDAANRARVSIATPSRVLNNAGPVKNSTRPEAQPSHEVVSAKVEDLLRPC
jgi:hypothetical protein